jgi:hypothetical protein
VGDTQRLQTRHIIGRQPRQMVRTEHLATPYLTAVGVAVAADVTEVGSALQQGEWVGCEGQGVFNGDGLIVRFSNRETCHLGAKRGSEFAFRPPVKIHLPQGALQPATVQVQQVRLGVFNF